MFVLCLNRVFFTVGRETRGFDNLPYEYTPRCKRRSLCWSRTSHCFQRWRFTQCVADREGQRQVSTYSQSPVLIGFPIMCPNFVSRRGKLQSNRRRINGAEEAGYVPMFAKTKWEWSLAPFPPLPLPMSRFRSDFFQSAYLGIRTFSHQLAIVYVLTQYPG